MTIMIFMGLQIKLQLLVHVILQNSINIANQIAKLIIKSISTIVSGLAKGIDTAAHEGCLTKAYNSCGWSWLRHYLS